jgi:hypothetical protein
MKKFIFIALLGSQMAFGLSLFGSAMDLVNAEKFCSKLAQVDRAECNEYIKGRKFISGFLDVCIEMDKKMSLLKPLDCLKDIANKSSPTASAKQAEICKELISSKNRDYVQKCLQANLMNDFAALCYRYIDSGKSYSSAMMCVDTLDGYTQDDLDMAFYRGHCEQIRDRTDYVKVMAPCLADATREVLTLRGRPPRAREQNALVPNQR